jgi:hypothetical protein
MTLALLAERDVVLRRFPVGDPTPVETSDEDDDMADIVLARACP